MRFSGSGQICELGANPVSLLAAIWGSGRGWLRLPDIRRAVWSKLLTICRNVWRGFSSYRRPVRTLEVRVALFDGSLGAGGSCREQWLAAWAPDTDFWLRAVVARQKFD